MKRNLLCKLLFVLFALTASLPGCIHAQNNDTAKDTTNVKSRPFEGKIYNKEYQVYFRFNLYEDVITVPGQEIFGEMPGYFRSDDDSRCWLITSAELAEDGKSAALSITNDYGSEDLEALLTYNGDGTFTLKQLEGSTLKIARKRKWVKMPKTLTFEKQ